MKRKNSQYRAYSPARSPVRSPVRIIPTSNACNTNMRQMSPIRAASPSPSPIRRQAMTTVITTTANTITMSPLRARPSQRVGCTTSPTRIRFTTGNNNGNGNINLEDHFGKSPQRRYQTSANFNNQYNSNAGDRDRGVSPQRIRNNQQYHKEYMSQFQNMSQYCNSTSRKNNVQLTIKDGKGLFQKLIQQHKIGSQSHNHRQKQRQESWRTQHKQQSQYHCNSGSKYENNINISQFQLYQKQKRNKKYDQININTLFTNAKEYQSYHTQNPQFIDSSNSKTSDYKNSQNVSSKGRNSQNMQNTIKNVNINSHKKQRINLAQSFGNKIPLISSEVAQSQKYKQKQNKMQPLQMINKANLKTIIQKNESSLQRVSCSISADKTHIKMQANKNIMHVNNVQNITFTNSNNQCISGTSQSFQHINFLLNKAQEKLDEIGETSEEKENVRSSISNNQHGLLLSFNMNAFLY